MVPPSCKLQITFFSQNSYRPYLHYINHVGKLINIHSVVDNSSPTSIGRIKQNLDYQRHREH